MSKKPGLAALKAQIANERPGKPKSMPLLPSDATSPEELIEQKSSRRYPTYREGKVPVGGYFSPELSRALHQLALDESEPGKPRVKIQALLGEAVDLLLQSRNRSPLGER